MDYRLTYYIDSITCKASPKLQTPPSTKMSKEGVKSIVSWLQQPPAFQFPATVNGNIPSPKFIQDRKAQLEHLVNDLGCLPLQHHIPGMRLWLRIDPLEGGGFGFSLDLDTVMAFVKHTARTTGNLVQSRVTNDQKFMQWVTDRVSGLPLEERRSLGFNEPSDTSEASTPNLRHRPTSDVGVTAVPHLQQVRPMRTVHQPVIGRSTRKQRAVTFTDPFATSNDDLLDTIVVARLTGTSAGTSTAIAGSGAATTSIGGKPAYSTIPKQKLNTGSNTAPETKTAAKMRPRHKPSTSTTTMEEPKPQGSMGARRSSRVTAPTAETHPLPDMNGLMHITIVYDGRLTAFLGLVQDMEGVESTKRMTATIIDVGVRTEYYHEVYDELSRTLGVSSISMSPNF